MCGGPAEGLVRALHFVGSLLDASWSVVWRGLGKDSKRVRVVLMGIQVGLFERDGMFNVVIWKYMEVLGLVYERFLHYADDPMHLFCQLPQSF